MKIENETQYNETLDEIKKRSRVLVKQRARLVLRCLREELTLDEVEVFATSVTSGESEMISLITIFMDRADNDSSMLIPDFEAITTEQDEISKLKDALNNYTINYRSQQAKESLLADVINVASRAIHSHVEGVPHYKVDFTLVAAVNDNDERAMNFSTNISLSKSAIDLREVALRIAKAEEKSKSEIKH